MKRKLSLVLSLILLITVIGVQKPKSIYAEDYITRSKFIEMVVKELKLKTDKTSKQPYIDVALESGILTKTTFGSKPNYDAIVTKSDAAVLLVRADEYLNGITVTDETIQLVMDKRISDIGKVSNSRKPFVAKAYALGYMVGTSNGTYSTSRRFTPSGKVTVSTANALVACIKDNSKRATLSPDYQVTRTTKLPSNAELYPYILDSYPNAYYDWEFLYMKRVSNGKPLYGTSELINMEDYVAPVDMTKYKYWDTTKEGLESWETKTRAMLTAIFNVDYRTIKEDKEWRQTILDTSTSTYAKESLELLIDNYIDLMTKNKTIIECDKVAVDMSTLYIDGGYEYVRVYVHYRINSALKMGQVDSANQFGISSLIFTRYSWPNLLNVKLGEWRDGYFDVSLCDNSGFGIYHPVITDYFHDVKVVK